MKNVREETAAMTSAEKAFIDRFVGEYCRPHKVVMAERLAAFVTARRFAALENVVGDFAMAAGPKSATTNDVNSPDEEVRFVFASEGEDDSPSAWRAEVTVPPKATPETMLTVLVRDIAGRPAEGFFTIAGCALPLSGGAAELSFGAFLAGIQKTDVSLRREGRPPSFGRLLFF